MIGRHRNTRRAAQSGMTLIELLVVCVVLTIVTAATVPMFGDVRAVSPAHAPPIRIDELLARCRELAIRRGTRVRLDIDSVKSRASIRIQAADGSDDRRESIVMDSATEFMTAHPAFSCDPIGVVQGPSVAVRDGRAIKTVAIDPIAGRVVEQR